MSTKSVDFRPLPTPEQIRAHGEGGLWETEGHPYPSQYKFWSDRSGPWFDCIPWRSDNGPIPATANIPPPPPRFRPLNPDGTPRDWAEIDAIVAGVPAAAQATTEPDYRAPTDAELRAHVANGGMWRADDWFYEVWTDEDGRLVGWCHCALPSTRGSGWDISSHRVFANRRKHLRPVDRRGKPMPWSAIAVPAALASAPIVTPPPDGKFQTGDVVRVLRFSDDERFEGGNPQWDREMEHCLDAPTTVVDCFGTWLSVKDSKSRRWSWPIKRVSFISQPSKAEPEQRIEAVVPATTPAPEFRKLTREIVEANPGQLWERNTSTDHDYGRVWKLAYREGTLESDYVSKKLPWNSRLAPMVDVSIDQSWRPLHPSSTPDNRQPMPWSELKAAVSALTPQSAVSHADSLGVSAVLQEIEDAVRRAIAERVLTQPTHQQRWVPYESGSFVPLPKDDDPITVASAIAIAREGARQAMLEVGQVQKPVASFKAWSPDGPSNITSIAYSDELDQPEVRGSDGLVIGLTQGVYKAQAHLSGDIGSLPLIFDIVVRHAATDAYPARTDILVGCRRTGFDSGKIDLCVDYILHDGLPPLAGIDALDLRSKTLDIAAEQWYSLSRQPNETDEQLRQRCRDAKAKENPMSIVTISSPAGTPAIPNFVAMSPEDRARYRAALDAADPPTFRDALRSGLEHAPVELALDKLHTFVSRLADLWTEGNEEERATVRRFLRDLLSSDYGKAAIGLGAGAAIPHAAPLAAKLLPDDKDAGPLLRRVGFILVERGTATGAKRLGLDIWDAVEPMLDELRQMLRDLVKGMKQADTVVGFLPPASTKPDFAAGVVEAETVTQKR